MQHRVTRRTALVSMAGLAAASWAQPARGAAQAPFMLATFAAEVTPPLGHPLLCGLIEPAKSVADPLFARGFVLLGAGKPLVFCSVDWCEIRNASYDAWRTALAQAAGTSPERVLVSCVHQHDAPLADHAAQRLCDQHDLPGAMFDLRFHDQALGRTAEALKSACSAARPVTHLGLGQAKVERIASTRRVELSDGRVLHTRLSHTRDETIRSAPEGQIDPFLKTLSFWEGATPLAALHAYATHPMSYYGRGEVSSDFVGLARARRQRDDERVFQVYASGCSGDVTGGKYNDATPDSRAAFTDRMYQAMAAAWDRVERHPLREVAFRAVPLRLPPRQAGEFAPAALAKALADQATPARSRIQAALGLSWQQWCTAGNAVDVPCLDFGPAQLLLLPGESFVAYQLAAQKCRPDSFVVTAGYGQCGPGYIPTERDRKEGFVEQNGWCWVAEESEALLREAIEKALRPIAF
jgi:hypothetical protein